MTISKRVRIRILIGLARLLRVPIAVHQHFFNAAPSRR